ncbi:MAG TPA: hypothetical protein VHM30_12280, partial [Gemmatimonadaceae bacterium]|nr:hypothetical protein [Gemmatimonadaceae bacterium]
QRNLQVFGFGGMNAEQESAASMYALVHNAATFTRDITLGIVVDPKEIRALRDPTIRAIGGKRVQSQPARPRAVLTVPGMAPGENRWVELAFRPTPGARRPVTLSIVELVNGVTVNGYSFVVAPKTLTEAIGETLLQHAIVFRRLADAGGLAGAADQSERAHSLSDRPNVEDYRAFLRANAKTIATITRSLVKSAGGRDPFHAIDAADALVGKSTDPAAAQPIHLTLLNRLDALQTMLQKEAGDVADIPQNVRWQRELFGRLKRVRGASEVVARSTEFLTAFEQRRIGVEGLSPLLTSLAAPLKEAADLDRSGGLARLLAAVSGAGSPAALQKAHRAFLQGLDAYVRKTAAESRG